MTKKCDSGADITNGNYGLGSSSISPNPLWRIYPSRLGLGQGIFEAVDWSEALSGSVLAVYPWFARGGAAHYEIDAGVETVNALSGGIGDTIGFRGVSI